MKLSEYNLDHKILIEHLSQMVGFSQDEISKELGVDNCDSISINELRTKMLELIDREFLSQ